jgi:hypothetical protein
MTAVGSKGHPGLASLATVACVCFVLASASTGRALRRAPSIPRVLHLHPPTRRLAAANSNVVSDGRYVLMSTPTVSGTRGTVIDEQTGQTTPLTTPPNCTILDGYSPLGGPWVLASCYPPFNSYALFDIPNRSWRTVYADAAVFAASPQCASNNCSATPVAVGRYWIQYYVNCEEHCYAPSYAFESIQTGEVRTSPKGWVVGGHTIPNLESENLSVRLCSPLVVPRGTNGLPGTFTFFGRYAVSTGAVNGGLGPSTSPIFLQKCGSPQRTQIDPNNLALAANNRAVVWSVDGGSLPQQGVLLPSLRPFTVTAPSKSASPSLGRAHLFFETRAGEAWETRDVFPPITTGG